MANLDDNGGRDADVRATAVTPLATTVTADVAPTAAVANGNRDSANHDDNSDREADGRNDANENRASSAADSTGGALTTTHAPPTMMEAKSHSNSYSSSVVEARAASRFLLRLFDPVIPIERRWLIYLRQQQPERHARCSFWIERPSS